MNQSQIPVVTPVEPNVPSEPRCPECGSANVTADAAVSWNPATHEWQVINVFDDGTCCEDCEATDIDFKWVPVGSSLTAPTG